MGRLLILVSLCLISELCTLLRNMFRSQPISAKVSLTPSQLVLLNLVFLFLVLVFVSFPSMCFLFLLLFPCFYTRRRHLAGILTTMIDGGERFGFSKIRSEGNFHQSQSKRKEHKTQKRKQNATTSVVSSLFLWIGNFNRFTSQSRRVTLRTSANKTQTMGRRSISFRSVISFIIISPSKQYGPDIKAMVQYFASTANRLRLPWCRYFSNPTRLVLTSSAT